VSLTRTLPQVTLEANGRSLADDELRALSAVRVQQRLSLPALCELTFADPPGPLSVVDDLAPGAPLRVNVRGQDVALFTGEVTAIERRYGPAHEREVRVRGYDRLHRLRKRQTIRTHVQVTVQDLFRDLAAELGLTVQSDDAGPVWQLVIQHRQSDFEFLSELADRCGLYFTVRNSTLHLLTLAGLGDPAPLALGESLLEARIETNGETSCRSIDAAGWNPLRVESHTQRASHARSGREVLAEIEPGQVGGADERNLVAEALQDDRHAEALAQSELDWRTAREVTWWGVAEGDSRLRPGTPIDVSGVDDSLTGIYVLTSVTHTIDERQGYLTELSTVPPAPRPRTRSAVTTLGVVTRVDDPDRLGRVRVTLPTYGEVETEWMQVLSPAAGADRGLMMVPDVGDRVLVLFTHDDPGQGLVLGGLYGLKGMPDSGVEGNAVKRYTLLTPNGQRIQLDDGRNLVRVEDHQGSYIEMSPDKVRLHAERDLEIEAPGKAIKIRGQKIDFDRA
jgi:uncharacterized protein involved in type VI secretion and phage assembly